MAWRPAAVFCHVLKDSYTCSARHQSNGQLDFSWVGLRFMAERRCQSSPVPACFAHHYCVPLPSCDPVPAGATVGGNRSERHGQALEVMIELFWESLQSRLVLNLLLLLGHAEIVWCDLLLDADARAVLMAIKRWL